MKTTYPISPWAGNACVESPDKKYTARIECAVETLEGAPTVGILEISNGMRRKNCNPSMIWSDDSKILAIPEWVSEKNQRLLLVNVFKKKGKYFPETYEILQLEKFENGILTGTHSPVYSPTRIVKNTNEINWD